MFSSRPSLSLKGTLVYIKQLISMNRDEFHKPCTDCQKKTCKLNSIKAVKSGVNLNQNN